MFGTPNEITVPHETSDKMSPKPKKVKPASAKIPLAIPMVPITITGAKTFGIICLVIILKFDSPIVFAAEIYSSVRTCKVVEYTNLVVPAQPNKPITMRIITGTGNSDKNPPYLVTN